MSVNKEKLLDWIKARISDHIEKVDEIHKRNDGIHPQQFRGNDRKEYDYHTGARAELVFLRTCVEEHKSLD